MKNFVCKKAVISSSFSNVRRKANKDLFMSYINIHPLLMKHYIAQSTGVDDRKRIRIIRSEDEGGFSVIIGKCQKTLLPQINYI